MPKSIAQECLNSEVQRRALIVDDSRAQRMVFARHLQRWGYATTEAESGAQALDLAAQTHFDLILSDWIMPGMNGLEFCRAFRACPREEYSYFILLTSKNDKDAVAEGLDVGADDFLSKPVSTHELRARINAGERLLSKEREVRIARARLVDAVEALEDGFVYFDARDRLVLANSRFRELYARSADIIHEGVLFEDMLRHAIARGQFPEAHGREEEWLRERMRAHRAGETVRQHLADGRVLQIAERPTADGGRVGVRVDVTELHCARETARKAEAQAKRQNAELRAALDELQTLYDAVDRDLMEARRLQQSLLRERQHDFGGTRLSLLLQSSGHVGGDMVGSFRISASRVGVYSIDVSGHGVAAAMLGARIGALFSGGEHAQNIALMRDARSGAVSARAPHDVAARMNELMLQEIETESYLTIAYADIDLASGRLQMVQAGHPHPLIQRNDGRLEYLGHGGLPIGLIPGAEYQNIAAQLHPGDRLFLYSDGISECMDPQGQEFSDVQLGIVLAKLARTRGAAFLDALKWELTSWSGKEEFDDDVSGALLEFDHPLAIPPEAPRYHRGIPVCD